jgi:hypothetical protein
VKNIAILIFTIILLVNLISVQSVFPTSNNNEALSFIITLQSSHPILEDSSDYFFLSSDTANSYIYQIGHPHLPKITETYPLPFGSTISSVTITENTPYSIVTVSKKIQPTQYPNPVYLNNQDVSKSVENYQIYSSSNLYPSEQIEYHLSAGIQDGVHMNFLALTWYPYRYSPQQNELFHQHSISIEIKYAPPKNPLSFSDEYDLLIIAPSSFYQEIQRLVQHKIDHGVNTLYTPVENIYEQYPGRDHAEQIKYYLKESAETLGITYVLFIGDIDKTPMRRTSIEVWQDDDILTDLYYSDIYDSNGDFSSWDPNNNNKFSEYTWEHGLLEFVDLYPDLYVGRLPCENHDQVDTVITKIITYETQTSSDLWFDRLILMGGDTFPHHGTLEGEVVTGNIADYMDDYGFEPIKLWTSQQNFRPSTINNEITKGAGFISYSGHGYELGFGTSPPDVDKRIEYFSPYIFGMFNGFKLPVLFFDACSTTKLDFNVEELHDWFPTPLAFLFCLFEKEAYSMENYYPCISWQLVKKANGGTIATIGSTRVAFTGVNENGAHWGAGLLNTRFFEAYTPGSTLGPLFTSAQNDYINIVGKECITLEEFTLIGDPSLHLAGYS